MCIDWILKLRLGPSLFGHKVIVYTNHPDNDTTGFHRSSYRCLSWQYDSTNQFDDTACFVDINIIMPGSFHYYFSSTDKSVYILCLADNFGRNLYLLWYYFHVSTNDIGGSGYFLVDPTLTYGLSNDVLPLDCIQCQTYVAKCLGQFSEWEDRLRVAKETGYNLIHFTPIQASI